MAHSPTDGKADFGHIYDEPDPRQYYRTLGALDYEIPQQALPTFETLLDEVGAEPATVLDVCCSYGVNAALMRCELHLDDLFERYRDDEIDALAPEQLMRADREFYAAHERPNAPRVLGLDLASHAIEYAQGAGLLAGGWAENLEVDEPSPELVRGVRDVDMITITGGVGYVTDRTIERLLSVFDEGSKPTVAAFVLRRYSYDGISDVLADHGLETVKQEGTFPQRRFASEQERATTLEALEALGVDPSGKEADGRYHADLFVSTPSPG